MTDEDDVLQDRWDFHFLCCFGTRNGEPRAEQVWQPLDSPSQQDELSLEELCRDPLPEWIYLLKKWKSTSTLYKLPWMRHRILHQAMTVLDRYEDRTQHLSELDIEYEFNDIRLGLASRSSHLIKLMTSSLTGKKIKPWELLYPVKEDQPNSELLAMELILTSLDGRWAPSRPIRRNMVTGEKLEYQLPLSVKPLSRYWGSEDRYLQQTVFPQIPMHRVWSVPDDTRVVVPAHAFSQSKSAPWSIPMMTLDDPSLLGPTTVLLNSFTEVDVHAYQNRHWPGYHHRYPLPYPNGPVYMTKSMFLRPRTLGYRAALDPYHLQKLVNFNNEFNNSMKQGFTVTMNWWTHAINQIM